MSAPLEHGTLTGYAYHKCRCERCCQANYDYHHSARLMRNGGVIHRPHSTGHGNAIVAVDTKRLRRALESDGRPIYRIEEAAGLAMSAIYYVLKRGSCRLATLDALCTELGIDFAEMEVSACTL